MNRTAFFWMNLDKYEPCPCGSGKKFKFCCLNKPYEPSPELLEDFELGQKLLKEFEKSKKNRSYSPFEDPPGGHESFA